MTASAQPSGIGAITPASLKLRRPRGVVSDPAAGAELTSAVSESPAVIARPAVTSPAPSELPVDRFLDREASWLLFNQRVLAMAEDSDIPLLERTRFLSIFASNLDEFFMVRVAGLKRRIATGMAVRSPAGLEPREVLEQISVMAHEVMDRHATVFTDLIRPLLAAEGITVVRWDELTLSEQSWLSEMFRLQVFPVLTPLAVDPAHPFPYISGLSLNLAVVIRNPKTEAEHFARVKVPPLLPRFIAMDEHRADSPGLAATEPGAGFDGSRFVPMEDVIAAHLDQLFPGMEVLQQHSFRVTRNEDLEVEEDEAENLLQALEKELMRRRFGPPVRLEVAEDIDDHVLDLLVRELGVRSDEVYRLPAPLDLRGLSVVADLERSHLRYPHFVATTHRALTEGVETSKPGDIFAAIRSRDVLLHHPYDSFSTSVQAFCEQAAADPRVLAIKQTLYRTSGDSPIVDALIDAAEAGKQVLAIVEIKARFDEQANISWARKLEQAGVHVVYGIVGLKTHTKLCLVVRQEIDGLRRYCHVGTGNYNPKTARMYEDLGLLTADPKIGEDVTRLFNQLSGYAPKTKYKRLLVAPRALRAGLIRQIDEEADRARAGESATIAMKMNSIVDEAVIDALYRAAQVGVQVDMVIRGICALRPGVPGLSENIRVRSILGRFLEHSRVVMFGAGVERPEGPTCWIGSADLMHRNLDRRVEALVPITDPSDIAHLQRLLALAMADHTSSFHLGPDGTWTRHHHDGAGLPLADLQTTVAQALRSHRRRRRR
ncbi:MAG: RNA degradosome polyphosphate kinase [Actinomycetota bacterium]